MKKIYNVLIVDDEELAQQDLAHLLADFKNINIIGFADSISSAKKLVEEFKPNLIFLDIKLTGESGFDLLEYLTPKIKIIFVTAYDDYAVRAFEVNAQDYLLKPVSKNRLANTIERLDSINFDENLGNKKLASEDSIFLKKNKGYIFLKIKEILFISAQDNYSEITTINKEKILVNKTMIEWENRLPDSLFSRIHRSTIINIEKVKKISPWNNYSFFVTLEGIEKQLVMSKRYFSKLKDLLS